MRRYVSTRDRRAYALVPDSVTSGKLYEAYVLSLLVERLSREERFMLRLVNSSYVTLKSSPGPINRPFPRIDVYKADQRVAEIWTDIEFLTLSYSSSGAGRSMTKGDCHELDIVVVEPDLTGYPSHEVIWLGVECKNTVFGKNFLREVLGVRRELSLLQPSQRTRFARWPRPLVPALPPSCLLVYSTDINLKDYEAPGDVFGIDFVHAPTP